MEVLAEGLFAHTVCSTHLTRVVCYGGSILEYCGDAIVNAANTGGVSGFGVDELVNRAAGDHDIKEARRAFGGIDTGEAKVTPSFSHTKVKWIIHAVGPVYRETSMEYERNKTASLMTKDQLLASAYQNSLRCAQKRECRSVAFCLLSAGVFRGPKPLSEVIQCAVESVVQFATAETHPPYFSEIGLVAFTPEEQHQLTLTFQTFQTNWL